MGRNGPPLGGPYLMARIDHNEYTSLTLSLLSRVEHGALLRNDDTGAKGWLHTPDLIEIDKQDDGTYAVVAPRYIFERAGLI